MRGDHLRGAVRGHGEQPVLLQVLEGTGAGQDEPGNHRDFGAGGEGGGADGDDREGGGHLEEPGPGHQPLQGGQGQHPGQQRRADHQNRRQPPDGQQHPGLQVRGAHQAPGGGAVPHAEVRAGPDRRVVLAPEELDLPGAHPEVAVRGQEPAEGSRPVQPAGRAVEADHEAGEGLPQHPQVLGGVQLAVHPQDPPGQQRDLRSGAEDPGELPREEAGHLPEVLLPLQRRAARDPLHRQVLRAGRAPPPQGLRGLREAAVRRQEHPRNDDQRRGREGAPQELRLPRRGGGVVQKRGGVHEGHTAISHQSQLPALQRGQDEAQRVGGGLPQPGGAGGGLHHVDHHHRGVLGRHGRKRHFRVAPHQRLPARRAGPGNQEGRHRPDRAEENRGPHHPGRALSGHRRKLIGLRVHQRLQVDPAAQVLQHQRGGAGEASPMRTVLRLRVPGGHDQTGDHSPDGPVLDDDHGGLAHQAGREPGGAGRHREDGVVQGLGEVAGEVLHRVQLLGPNQRADDGEAVLRAGLHRLLDLPGRVQPDRHRGAVGDRAAGAHHQGGPAQGQALQGPSAGRQAHLPQPRPGHLHHHEPRLRGQDRAPRQPQDPLPPRLHDGPRLHPHRRNHALLRGLLLRQGAQQENDQTLQALLRTALPTRPLRLRDEGSQERPGNGRQPEAGRAPHPRGRHPHQGHAGLQHPEIPVPRHPPLQWHHRGPLPRHQHPAQRPGPDHRQNRQQVPRVQGDPDRALRREEPAAE